MRRTFRLIAVLLAAALATVQASPVPAMTFHLVTKGQQRSILATGEIVTGDAERLAAALNLATRDAHGTKEMLLNSPGGLVGEAFAMADVLDQVGVTTIVPAGALCASACASVVFVSGKYRVVDTGGALIVHSCFDARTGQAMADCDAIISEHAQYEGVSGRAMMAFQVIAGTRSAILFDKKDAACYGLTLAPGAKPAKVAPCIAAALKAKKH